MRRGLLGLLGFGVYEGLRRFYGFKGFGRAWGLECAGFEGLGGNVEKGASEAFCCWLAARWRLPEHRGDCNVLKHTVVKRCILQCNAIDHSMVSFAKNIY